MDKQREETEQSTVTFETEGRVCDTRRGVAAFAGVAGPGGGRIWMSSNSQKGRAFGSASRRRISSSAERETWLQRPLEAMVK